MQVLAVRLDSLGDVLLAEPALRSLAALGDVTLLCGPPGLAAAELIDAVDRTIVFECPWILADPGPVAAAELRAVLHQIEAAQPDMAVVFTSSRQSALPTALMLRLAGVPLVGAYSHGYAGSLLDLRLREDRLSGQPVHEVERNLTLAASMGAPLPDDRRMRVVPAPLPRPVARRLPDHFVVVHPGASAPARTLGAHRWVEITAALLAAGRRVVVTGSAGEAHEVRSVRGVVDLTGALTFGELASVLAAADVVCVGNTGPMHLAAAVGTPVAACMPPTVPVEEWRPWLVDHVLVHRDAPCAPCFRRDCPLPGHPCADVGPREVVAAVDRLAGLRLAVSHSGGAA